MRLGGLLGSGRARDARSAPNRTDAERKSSFAQGCSCTGHRLGLARDAAAPRSSGLVRDLLTARQEYWQHDREVLPQELGASPIAKGLFADQALRRR